MTTMLVMLVVYGKQIADNFAGGFMSLTRPPPDAGAAPHSQVSDDWSRAYRAPDGSTVSVDEMMRFLTSDAGGNAGGRVIGALREAPSDDAFVARVRAFATIAVSTPTHLRVVGHELSTLLDIPLSPARLRAVLDALQFLAGKTLPPRATVWKNYWASVDAGVPAR